jgi:hypothetical protein
MIIAFVGGFAASSLLRLACNEAMSTKHIFTAVCSIARGTNNTIRPEAEQTATSSTSPLKPHCSPIEASVAFKGSAREMQD